MIILSTCKLSEKECYTTRLEVSNYQERESDIVFRTDISNKIKSKAGMPKYIEYSMTIELVEVVVMTDVNTYTVKTTAIDSDYIRVELLQPILFRYTLAIGSYIAPIIVRLESGFSFEEPQQNITSQSTLKSILALVAVDAIEFKPLREAMQKSLEREIDS